MINKVISDISESNENILSETLQDAIRKFMDEPGKKPNSRILPEEQIEQVIKESSYHYFNNFIKNVFNIAINPKEDRKFIQNYESEYHYKKACMLKYCLLISIIFRKIPKDEEGKQLLLIQYYGKTMPIFKESGASFSWFFKTVEMLIPRHKNGNIKYLRAWTDGVVEYFIEQANFDKKHFEDFVTTSYFQVGYIPDVYKVYNESFKKYGINVTLMDCRLKWE